MDRNWNGSEAVIVPDWPAPVRVRAFFTTRTGGCSAAPYDSLNLALHVGDDAQKVLKNRKSVQKRLKLPQKPVFLDQIHSAEVVKIDDPRNFGGTPSADACWTDAPGVPLVVMTADCLPILLSDVQGRVVAAVHAGWRGLENGVIDAAVSALPVMPASMLAWIGPGISRACFQVGGEVRDRMLDAGRALPDHFDPDGARWKMDLAAIARWQLGRLGVGQVFDSGLCTFSDPKRFFSYRRDGITGRMGAFIWIGDHL